ncbi:class I SAM-dependent methyltransferase [Gammaproteobacteria bacterium]|jgi:SAM-dependent methyltransferase|nr:class I SAM-dependent methyltransferase [Gammaproteobacteria bacterium]MDB9947876.1 class I SAM-dependent methyltransferase [Gammaproteobacteria bacterium]
MSNQYDLDIKNHYDQVAANDKNSSTSTMADLFIRESETKFIINQINKYSQNQDNNELTVLDVGCGNGYTLEILSDEFPNFNLHGLEFTDSLREIANKRFGAGEIQVAKGDIRDRDSLPKDAVDVLLCQRVLINLLAPEDQERALNNLIELVNPGGLLLFIECFQSGLENLNSARKEFELDELPPAHHNLYLKDQFFQHDLLTIFDKSEEESLSTHYFISRVLHETFLRANDKEFIRNSHFVRFFSNAFPGNVGQYAPLKTMSFIKV